MLRFGIIGLPVATSVVTLVSAVWLGVRLRRIIPGVGADGVPGALARTAVVAALMGVLVWTAVQWGGGVLAEAGLGTKVQEVLLTAGGIGIGLAVFAVLAKLMRIREFFELMQAWARR